MGGAGPFTTLELERKFSTGLQGKPPNLDVFLDAAAHAIAIESKLTEQFEPAFAEFQPSYDRVVAELAHESWRELYAELRSRPDAYLHVGAGQLLRHYR